MSHSRRHRKHVAHSHWRTIAAITLLVIAVLAGSAKLVIYPSHFPEAKFTDASAHGLHIVPASGESTPNTPPPIVTPPQPTPRCTDTTSSSCGFTSVCNSCTGACTTTGSFNPSLPGCLPSGCGAGTLNDKCPTSPPPAPPPQSPPDCPPGQHHSGGTACFTDTSSTPHGCGPGTLNDQCSSSSCPTNFYYCSADDLYQRTYGAAPACRSQDTFITHCDLGCDAATNVCNPSTGTSASITARPSLVRSGDSTAISVQATGVRSCAVNGTNGDTWTCSNVNCATMSHATSPLRSQTSYMLTCSVPGQSNIVKSVTVNIVPVFNEN